jgi:hypothetical protein
MGILNLVIIIMNIHIIKRGKLSKGFSEKVMN